ncbi:MAG TPA: tRNA (adenosine(37)-N6)-threonylcarbamoyltransferase complex ATPase subunit type 1 TsaE [Blastocatellia bacterium]|nr:tRNA (adenosine(37)-N6)-threonylcarbamoyltransferase complex ATPase subunit type 1 TsaE [Blastocatellia bacterium]
MITHSPDETFEYARKLGERLDQGAVILLSGDLGAGKTVFAKGIAAALEIDPADVTSPSFTLVNTYKGKKTLHHADLYRLDVVRSVDLGLDEMFDDRDAVTVVEWAERLNWAPPDAIRVTIEYVSESERKITVDIPKM